MEDEVIKHGMYFFDYGCSLYVSIMYPGYRVLCTNPPVGYPDSVTLR
jgi:hypothetical protein